MLHLFTCVAFLFFFFFNTTATPEIYTLSLHDALPISHSQGWSGSGQRQECPHSDRPSRFPSNAVRFHNLRSKWRAARSEEHTSELQSLTNLVCRLLLEKKKKNKEKTIDTL